MVIRKGVCPRVGTRPRICGGGLVLWLKTSWLQSTDCLHRRYSFARDALSGVICVYCRCNAGVLGLICFDDAQYEHIIAAQLWGARFVQHLSWLVGELPQRSCNNNCDLLCVLKYTVYYTRADCPSCDAHPWCCTYLVELFFTLQPLINNQH